MASRSMTLDDLELLQGRILSQFRRISQIWEPPAAKQTSTVIEGSVAH